MAVCREHVHFQPLWILTNSFAIWFIYHKIHTFKCRNLVVFSNSRSYATISTNSISFASLFFSPCCLAKRILIPPLGMEPVPPSVEGWSPIHWTAREMPIFKWLFPVVPPPCGGYQSALCLCDSVSLLQTSVRMESHSLLCLASLT